MKKVILINGSPNGKRGVSNYFLEELSSAVAGPGYAISFIQLLVSTRSELDLRQAIDETAKADAVVFSVPLYIYCLPGSVITFLDAYRECAKRTRRSDAPTTHAIVNCGFPDPLLTREALLVLRHFCRHSGFHWRFGVGIGAGGVVRATKGTFLGSLVNRLAIRAVRRIAANLHDSPTEPQRDVFVKPEIPNWLFVRMGNANWKPMVKAHGLERSDVYRKPYGERDLVEP